MKFSTALAHIALASTGVLAEQAIVRNNCNSTTVYVQSFPYDGSAAGPLTPVNPGQTFAENLRASGSTVKIAVTKTLDNPLFFGYSFSSNPAYAYYEFSTQFGNPFANARNILSPGAGCQQFNCGAGQADCYSTPSSKKVYGCPQPVDLIATLCV